MAKEILGIATLTLTITNREDGVQVDPVLRYSVTSEGITENRSKAISLSATQRKQLTTFIANTVLVNLQKEEGAISIQKVEAPKPPAEEETIE